MKNKLLIIAVFLLSHICTAFAENATLSISNSSDYYLTVKIMKYGGGLYTTLYYIIYTSKANKYCLF